MVKGAYCLIIRLDNDKSIRIGKLSNTSFKKGYYCYVGSALNNLDKRIDRHKKKTKKLRWHIDYFLKHAKIIDVVKIVTDKKIECKLSKRIKKIADVYVKDFGCSDCKCRSHLYYFNKKPTRKFHKYLL